MGNQVEQKHGLQLGGRGNRRNALSGAWLFCEPGKILLTESLIRTASGKTPASITTIEIKSDHASSICNLTATIANTPVRSQVISRVDFFL